MKYITIDYWKIFWTICACILAYNKMVNWWTVILIGTYGIKVEQKFSRQ